MYYCMYLLLRYINIKMNSLPNHQRLLTSHFDFANLVFRKEEYFQCRIKFLEQILATVNSILDFIEFPNISSFSYRVYV